MLFTRTIKLSSESDYTKSLEKRAKKQRYGWRSEYEAYVTGLFSANAISSNELNALQTLAKKCQETCSISAMLLLTFWPWWIIFTTSVTTTYNSSIKTIILIYCIMFLFLFYVNSQIIMPRKTHYGKMWKRMLSILISSTIFTGLIFLLSMAIPLTVFKKSYDDFSESMKMLEKDDDFINVKVFAKKYLGVTFELDSSYYSWAYTHLFLPHSGPAFMRTHPILCPLGINVDRTFNHFPAKAPLKRQQILRGVMMHELGHCVDINKSYPTFRDARIDKRSIPPKLRNKVTGLDSFFEDIDTPDTNLWREAFADIFTIGYWRLEYNDDWKILANSLKDKRTKHKDDIEHSTMCWISHAIEAAPPKSGYDLPQWATKMRSSANCSLPSDINSIK